MCYDLLVIRVRIEMALTRWNVNCPHCGARITAEMRNCVGCGWKIRLSQILVQPMSYEDSLRRLPISDIYYLFADKFLEQEKSPEILSVQPGQPPVERLISERGTVPKHLLAVGLCRIAFIWLAVSGHLLLETAAFRRRALTLSKQVAARPTGLYQVPVGSLESRILDEVYDRRQGSVVEEVMSRLRGFWYDGDPYDWVIQIVRRHVLSTPFLTAASGNAVDLAQIKRLESRIGNVGMSLNEFTQRNPELAMSLWHAVHQGLTNKKG